MEINKTNSWKDILVIVIGLAIIDFIFDIPYLNIVYLSIGFFSLSSTYIKNIILKVWYKIALTLGWLNTRILLSIVFYLVLTPLALISSLFIKNRLQLKNKNVTTYKARNHTYKKIDIEDMW
jgi:hypothetical protein